MLSAVKQGKTNFGFSPSLRDRTALVTGGVSGIGATIVNRLVDQGGRENIRVNCVIPGFIRTKRHVSLWLTPELEKSVHEGQCLQELIEPGYVANTVTFLASDDARMCTLGVFPVNGGWI